MTTRGSAFSARLGVARHLWQTQSSAWTFSLQLPLLVGPSLGSSEVWNARGDTPLTRHSDLLHFRVSSCLANAEEWQDIKRFLIQFLQGDFEDSCSNDEFRDLAKALFAQAFQGIPPKQVSMDSVEDVDFHQRHLSVRSIGPSQDFGNMSEARAFLAERVHLASAEDKATALLTSIVRVSGRFPHLPRDAVLVDLPELEDTHVLRSSSAERYLSMQCTHARYCLPTHEGKLRNNESIHSQIRILAWGGCLEDVVLVRTFGDTKKPAKDA